MERQGIKETDYFQCWLMSFFTHTPSILNVWLCDMIAAQRMNTFSNNRLANKWYLVKMLVVRCEMFNYPHAFRAQQSVRCDTIYAIMTNESSSMAITLILIWWNMATKKYWSTQPNSMHTFSHDYAHTLR